MKVRRFTYKSNNEARSRNQFYRTKAISILYSESVFVVLGTVHAKRMPVRLCHIFPRHKRQDFREKVIECKMRF
jgi:hypothetical protein